MDAGIKDETVSVGAAETRKDPSSLVVAPYKFRYPRRRPIDPDSGDTTLDHPTQAREEPTLHRKDPTQGRQVTVVTQQRRNTTTPLHS